MFKPAFLVVLTTISVLAGCAENGATPFDTTRSASVDMTFPEIMEDESYGDFDETYSARSAVTLL